MHAGRLNRRVVIEQLAAGQDSVGQPVASWSTLATVWANIRHLSGAESIKGDADTSIVKASIRIRHRLDVTAGMRVASGTDVYDIKAVLRDEERREYLDLVSEKVN